MDQSLRWNRNRIELAHAPDFTLGAARIRPSRREIGIGKVTQTVEPRVMQILVALAEARGATLSRDDLIERCWDGLAVTDDAITQSIAKLRKALAGVEGVSVETVPRVGYRLVHDGVELPAEPAPSRSSLTRRQAIVAGSAAAASAAAFSAWTLLRPSSGSEPPTRSGALPATPQAREADRLHTAAVRLFRQRTLPAYGEAERLLRRAVAIDPSHAPSWARLAMTVYAPGWFATVNDPQARMRLRTEGIGYARRALAIDPNLAEANQAMGFLLKEYEPLPWYERAAALDPDDPEIQEQLADILGERLELRRALQAALRAVDSDPTFALATRTALDHLQRFGRRAEALRLIDRYEQAANSPAEARRMRLEFAWAEGRFADTALLCAQALAAGDPNAYWPRSKLALVATHLGDPAMAQRMVRLDGRLREVLATFADPQSAMRRAREAPDEWWVGLAPGRRARLLLNIGQGRTFLELYDGRYANVAEFWGTNRSTADQLAPPLILAMRAAGRTGEADDLRARFAADAAKIAREGDVSHNPSVLAAELAALDGKPEEAARGISHAVALGWKAQGIVMEPDSDPTFAAVRAHPVFQQAIAAFRAAIAAEAAAYRRIDFARFDLG